MKRSNLMSISLKLPVRSSEYIHHDMKIQKWIPIMLRKWSWTHLANANSAFLSCGSYRWSWSAFNLGIYWDQNYQIYCRLNFFPESFVRFLEMLYRFSLLPEKSSVCSIIFFHFTSLWSTILKKSWRPILEIFRHFGQRGKNQIVNNVDFFSPTMHHFFSWKKIFPKINFHRCSEHSANCSFQSIDDF